ncbi:hypothetical protein [Streptomyces sp. NPDC047981]|uniref:hypothetical protein n=1 Tax=Streptomyces sp. NPDC047981 TaxID=3154610 RepID=UPI003430FE9F
MSARLTDRDERQWQRRAEERRAEPVPVGRWIRKLGAAMATAGRRRASTGVESTVPSRACPSA